MNTSLSVTLTANTCSPSSCSETTIHGTEPLYSTTLRTPKNNKRGKRLVFSTGRRHRSFSGRKVSKTNGIKLSVQTPRISVPTTATKGNISGAS